MAFNPLAIEEDGAYEGHLDADPMYEVLMAVQKTQATGRFTVADAAGDNHMYFMQGQPVGVQLSEYIHPLGQLLLELGRVDGRGFVAAQRLIWAGNRLAGQVFKELGYLDDKTLKDVLAVQARKKAEHFCRYASRGFQFARGLSYLSGFSATPLNIHTVIFLAVRQQMGPHSREVFLEEMKGKEVRLRAPPESPLPAPLPQYGFGPPEDRFLQRLASGWQQLEDLAETGTLPSGEMAVLMRYLELCGRLDARVPPPRDVQAALTSNTEDEVFSTSRPHVTNRPPAVPAPERPRAARKPEPPPRAPPRAAVPPARVSSVRAVERSSFPSERTLEPVVKKKKKTRRAEPEPSVATSAISETKREKTNITPLPSIVIEDE